VLGHVQKPLIIHMRRLLHKIGLEQVLASFMENGVIENYGFPNRAAE
jgi:hypothetical protein